MSIRTNGTTTIENIHKKFSYLWKHKARNKKLLMLISFIIGAGLFTYGLFDKFIIKTSPGNNKSFSYYQLNIFISIGLAFILLTILILMNLIKDRRSYRKKVDKIIHDLKNFNYSYELTENTFSYLSEEMSIGIKWDLFSGYYLKPEYLIILFDNELSPTLMITKSELADKDFLDILNYVKKKLSRSS